MLIQSPHLLDADNHLLILFVFGDYAHFWNVRCAISWLFRARFGRFQLLLHAHVHSERAFFFATRGVTRDFVRVDYVLTIRFYVRIL